MKKHAGMRQSLKVVRRGTKPSGAKPRSAEVF